MINKDKYIYIQVKISKKEYELYKSIVDKHNYNGLRHDYFRNYEKISLSKLGLAGLRMFTKKLLDSDNWGKYEVIKK